MSRRSSEAAYDNVIVFGPTGDVGVHVALEASKRGAKVWLAMRDPTKTIKEIASDVEKSGSFARVQADLTDPASVTKAVKESGAKAAYLYAVQGSSDSMRGSLQALQDAGVEHVVFLSSCSIKANDVLREIPREAVIPYLHAQVEIAAEEVGIPYFSALRPAYFASNHIRNFLDRDAKPPKATHTIDDAMCDNITEEDIGAVGAAVLVKRPSERKEIIYLSGPELMTEGQCWEVIKKITGRHDIDSTPITKQEAVERAIANHMPPAFAEYLTGIREKWVDMYREPLYPSGAANIKKYSGKEPLKFADYVEAHKAEWQAL